jgi:hypothetical protein
MIVAAAVAAQESNNFLLLLVIDPLMHEESLCQRSYLCARAKNLT